MDLHSIVHKELLSGYTHVDGFKLQNIYAENRKSINYHFKKQGDTTESIVFDYNIKRININFYI